MVLEQSECFGEAANISLLSVERGFVVPLLFLGLKITVDLLC